MIECEAAADGAPQGELRLPLGGWSYTQRSEVKSRGPTFFVYTIARLFRERTCPVFMGMCDFRHRTAHVSGLLSGV